jgi:hypothetical protein
MGWGMFKAGVAYLSVDARPRTLDFFEFATERTRSLTVFEKPGVDRTLHFAGWTVDSARTARDHRRRSLHARGFQVGPTMREMLG